MLPLLYRRHVLALAATLALGLSACDDSSSDLSIPAAPTGLGQVDSAPVQNETSVPPFVDNAATNQRGDPCHATVATNAGVRVLKGFLDLWTPATLLVDAGVNAAASGGCAAITAYTGNGMDGTVLNQAVLNTSLQYVVSTTTARTADEASASYYDDRRGKGYSVTDGMGPLTAAWRSAAQQTTTITSIPADATTVAYNDGGNNTGVGSSGGNATFGAVVDFVNNVGNNASTEPAKRFYKFARPWRWSNSVVVTPTLVPAESSTPATDGGFPSGHTAEAVRDALAMAYVMPERYQEMVARALELGRNRIVAGMHSPLDVIGGRILGTASAVGNLAAATPTTRAAAYAQAHTALMAAAGTTDWKSFYAYAHSGTSANDRFADTAGMKATAEQRLTFGFSQIASATQPAQVPKSAEVLLETRLPYLSADQRRVVLKTTALPSGYPVMDDAEGYGRLNLIAAADGYGAFNGDVSVTMDASQGGFSAADSWKNDISGAGMLTKDGSGSLSLTGANSYSGGTVLKAGTLVAGSASALGSGDVYASGGTLVTSPTSQLALGGKLTLLAGSTLQLTLGDPSQNLGRIAAAGTLTVDGAALQVNITGVQPVVGESVLLISAGHVNGHFGNVTVNGHQATVVYSQGQVRLKITA
ncbi:phosphatase PAP2 family protein [Ideonella sp. B508-1]|uniref:acid phosphatase n=1 Tax=Ideonella sp. B508-1 TaxID=137716 RepID=UPI000345F907|nr:phosphatase PAP2 family protein [Ideonella sp. B508-1]